MRGREVRKREMHLAGAFIIVFREVIEAGLIIGIVLAVTRGLPSRGLYISGGILAGLLGAALVAAFASALSEALAGAGQEVFNAAVLAIAVVMLGWHNVWMARHGRQISKDLHRLGHDVVHGARSITALAIVVAMAVLREGSEVVLFLYGVVIASREPAVGLLAGSLLGLALGGGISALTYKGLLVIPPRYLFKVTSVLIGLMAAGMAAQSVAFLEQANIATRLGETVWNSSWLLADNSLAGRVLHTLAGYTSSPTQLQLVAYAATLGAIFGLMKLLAPPAEHGRKLATN
ncbi:MAG: FTR1 family protein [Beijerinckiaceae bacterium]|nr:FTR1 family protein [Beijerinckiaceae bacterium]